MAVGILTTLCVPFMMAPSRASSKRILIRDSGGIINQEYNEVLYKPFSKKRALKLLAFLQA